MDNPFRQWSWHQILLSSLVGLCLLVLFPITTHANTEISGDITENTVWNQTASPYLISTQVTVQKDITLTIEPDVIIKLNGSTAGLTINGKLQAEGTTEQPIIFTSYRDDTYGGDTNNDGQTTEPVAGDWNRIYFTTSSSGLLAHTVVTFGGNYGTGVDYGMIKITSDDVTITASELSDSPIRLITISYASPLISANTMSNPNGDYIIGMVYGSPEITDNYITACGKTGIYAIGTYDTSLPENYGFSAPHIARNVIADCKSFGIYSSGTGELIEDNTLINNTSYGIQVYSGYIGSEPATSTINTVTIRNNHISNSGASGIWLYNVDQAEVLDNTITNCFRAINVGDDTKATINNNFLYDNTEYGVYRDTSESWTINAENNWWGDNAGPYHTSSNPWSTGDRVSDGIDYDPWLSNNDTVDTTPPDDITRQRLRIKLWRKTIIWSWTNPTDADFNHVRIVRIGDDGSIVTLTDLATETVFVDNTLAYDVSYTYTFYALDDNGNSSAGVVTKAHRLRRPTPRLVHLQSTASTIVIRWRPLASRRALQGYRVYYGTTQDQLTNIVTAGRANSYTLTNLETGTEYFVAVAAYNWRGIEGPLTEIQSIIVE